jgi:two-component sensor histidine kinase
MLPCDDIDALLDAHMEMAFILRADGTVERLNRRARAFCDPAIQGQSIFQFAGSPEPLRRFVARCAGTSGTLVGAASLRGRMGEPVRFRLHGSLMTHDAADGTRIMLRCSDARDDRFTLIDRQVRELNAEVRKRRPIQRSLEESLRERDTLLREIHHRVKNNVQMLSSMLALAQREATHPEARAVLSDAQRRVASLGAVQQVVFESSDHISVSGRHVVETLVAQIADAVSPEIAMRVTAEDRPVTVDQAQPLALAINELVTNAIRFSNTPEGEGEITIVFREAGPGLLELSVRNPGTLSAASDTGRKGSGLGLVRALARQLLGTFEIESNAHVTCSIRFPAAPKG